MTSVTVQNATSVPSMDPARAGKMDVVVVYAVLGRGTPSVVMLPAESFTESAALAKIQEIEARHAGIIGKTFTI